jgi:hypothetical protein
VHFVELLKQGMALDRTVHHAKFKFEIQILVANKACMYASCHSTLLWLQLALVILLQGLVYFAFVVVEG